MRYWASILVLLSLAFGAAWADPYIIQPEDVLNVSVYGHDELSREVVVLDTGYFHYPIVGRVDVAGKTPEDVAAIVTSGLKKELLDPKVTVSVKQPAMRRVYVSGSVARAGSYAYRPGWRVSHLIAEAGGLQSKPDVLKATLVRSEQAIPIDLVAVSAGAEREADLPLQPGDLLQVQSDTNLIHVVGQVRSPGDYQLKTKLGVLQAVAMAGGVTDAAALTRAHIVRGSKILPVDLHSLLVEGKSEGNVELGPGDTVIVPSNEARIAVLGGVTQPGTFDLPDGRQTTLADALALAHGANRRARLDRVQLVRQIDGKQDVRTVDVSRFLKKGDTTQNPFVEAGDVIYVSDGSSIDAPNILQALTSLASPVLYTILGRR